MNFATNTLAPFVLTSMLLPVLRRAARAPLHAMPWSEGSCAGSAFLLGASSKYSRPRGAALRAG